MTVEQDPHWAASVAWLVQVLRSVGNDGTVHALQTAPAGIPADALARAADFHGVAGFARLGLAEPTPELTAVVHQAQARHLRALDDLRLVVSALGGAGVDVLVVKGPALVATCYAGPLLRSYVDLDVLVRPSQLREAVAALEAAGWTLLDANWPLLSSAGVGELKLEGPTGGALDLHWSFGKEGDPAPPVDTLMRRSVGVNDGELHYRTLGPADFAVHVALHAAASGGHRLVWLTDVRGALAAGGAALTSDALARTAREWGARPGLALMVSRMRRTLGPEPTSGPTLARRGVWTTVTRMVDRRWPPELVGESGSASRLVARSCRRNGLRSLLSVGSKVLAWRRQGGGQPLGPEVLHNASDPRSGLYASGGQEGREAFFDAVVSTGEGAPLRGREPA